MILVDDGEVYVCGWNKNGQLGLASPVVDVTTFSLILSLTCKVTKVSCGWNHTLALSDAGGLFVWGSNTFGQLGEPGVWEQASCPLKLSDEVYVICLFVLTYVCVCDEC